MTINLKKFNDLNIHKEILIKFLITTFASVLPLIMGAAIASGFGQWQNVIAFIDDGELYIYGVGFYTQAMYLLYFQKRDRIPKPRDYLFWGALFIFVIS